MNIAIVGAGAMGSLFGALLREAGNDVMLIDIWREHVAVINRDGLMIIDAQGSRSVPIQAATGIDSIQSMELVIVFVKATHTGKALDSVQALLAGDGRVLTLQNGMGNAEAIAARVGAARVLAGTTSHGATLLGPGRIRHAGVGPTTIGVWQGGALRSAERVAACFNAAGIETEVTRDVRPVLWNKLLVNIGINAITALTGIKNGQLLDLACTRDLMQAAVEEAVSVAVAQEIPVHQDAVERVFQIARATAANRSSMGQDVDGRRQTEIEAINGFVVAQAQRRGLPTPVNQALKALVNTLEAHYPSNDRSHE